MNRCVDFIPVKPERGEQLVKDIPFVFSGSGFQRLDHQIRKADTLFEFFFLHGQTTLHVEGT